MRDPLFVPARRGWPLALLAALSTIAAIARAEGDAAAPSGPSTPTATHGAERVVELGLGANFSCARTNLGRVHCWGSAIGAMYGRAVAEQRTAAEIASISGATRLVAGASHACVLDALGALSCWGTNYDSQLGGGSRFDDALRRVSLPGRVLSASAGAAHTCAVVEAHGLYCWGNNSRGQTGVPSNGSVSAPTHVAAAGDVVEVAAGGYFTCARRANGAVLCWGDNESGQLGRTGEDATPALVAGISGARSIRAGYNHVCVTLADRSARCWGLNAWGAINASNDRAVATPASLSSLGAPVRDLSLGYAFTCAITDEPRSTVRCWGHAAYGKCGRAPTSARNATATTVTLSDEPVSLFTGHDHSCAILRDGGVECWGTGARGELGDGRESERRTPTLVAGLTGITRIGAFGAGTCAGSRDALHCWGDGRRGRFALPSDWGAAAPARFGGDMAGGVFSIGGSNVCMCAPGWPCSCAGEGLLDQSGYVLGLVSTMMIDLGPRWRRPRVRSIAATESVTCAARSDGVASCFGSDNTNLIPGTRIPGARRAAREVSFGLRGPVELHGGQRHVCALDQRGTLACFGHNDAQQINDGAAMVGPAVVFTGVRRARRARAIGPLVALGAHRTCAIFSGAVRCRGGLPGSPISWTTAEGITDAEALYGGDESFCARRIGGAWLCWGSNLNGQLGLAPSSAGVAQAYATTPTDAPLWRGAVDLAFGTTHGCGRWADGTVRCMGSNTLSQLGDGTTSWTAQPVRVRFTQRVAGP